MKTIIILIGAVLTIVGTALLMALPTMWLWNWLMPDIFSLTEINFWQALGINVFSAILFKDYSSNKD